MRVLVAGAAGFLGSHMCEKLIHEGHEVIAVDNFYTGSRTNLNTLMDFSQFEIIRHDVTLPIYIECDSIMNFASPASPIQYQKNPVQTLKTNVLGSINLLGLAKRLKIPIFQASTSEVYGDPEISPQGETYWGRVNPIGLRACYDEGKRAAEALFFDYHRQFNVDIRVARIFNTYGPRMAVDDGRVVSNFIVAALTNKPITIYGNGSQTRSLCYVSDLIQGINDFVFHSQFKGPLNLGNVNELTISELARKIISITNSNSQVEHRELPADDPKQRLPDITLASSIIKWSPKVSLEEGLKHTIEFFAKTIKKLIS
jgi:UDP-glucuronate decarboxylase